MTPHQLRIVKLRIDGLTMQEIAVRMHLSWRTVAVHLHEVYRELDVHNVAQLTKAISAQESPRPAR